MATSTTSRVFRIELIWRDAEFDGEARHLQAPLAEAGMPGAKVSTQPQYLLEGDLTLDDAKRVARELLVDAATQTFEVSAADDVQTVDGQQVVVQLRTGVMDPVAQSVVRGATHLGVPVVRASTVRKYRFTGDTGGADLVDFARRQLANDVIEEVFTADRPLTTLQPPAGARQARVEVNGFREMDVSALVDLSKSHGLALDEHEMKTIQAHFAEAGRNPTDAELETIAQTWSEHCKHKTLTGLIDYAERRQIDNEVETERIDNLLKSTIARATHELMAKEDKNAPFCLSVFVDNAGVIAFDDDLGVAMKVETHNHPSALEPYGGAGTGIGGVIRDIMGTGLGARPIVNTDVFCFGPPDWPREKLPAGTLHPRRVMNGVIAGVRDYGNRMGIPTANGALFFHERYLGNPLVYAGCVGMIPRDKVEKAARDGDVIVSAGGRTGRDGIGGATFSSVELTSESETVSSGAVQIGNAIEEKRLLDALLQARDRGLYSAVTDCGAGGLSSAVGEMGEHLGAEVDLETVPLKYAGLTYREIWLSEAQERMVMAVPPEKLDELLALFRAEDVDATAIGTFRASGRLVLRHEGEVVADLDMDFLHNGLPRTVRQAEWEHAKPAVSKIPTRKDGRYSADLLAILALPNVASKEPVVRQYDHEVQSMSAVKPFVGVRQDGPSDAAVLTPVPGSRKGVVISNGLNPELGLIDPYHMAANAIDEAVRNALAVGGSRGQLAILDNFSWGNCNKPDRLGGLVRASKACYDLAMAYGTPFISGKDSLNNEYVRDDGEVIAIPPTLLISACGIMDDVPKQAMTMDLKRVGSRLFVLGHTRAELGGAHFLLAHNAPSGTDVPRVRPDEAVATFDLLEQLRDAGHLLAVHDCAEGGIAVAVAEMALAGDLGVDGDASPLRIEDANEPHQDPPGAPRELDAQERDVVRLFSESPSRFVVEVPADSADAVVKLAVAANVPMCALGTVTDGDRVTIKGELDDQMIDASLASIRQAWQGTLARYVG